MRARELRGFAKIGSSQKSGHLKKSDGVLAKQADEVCFIAGRGRARVNVLCRYARDLSGFDAGPPRALRAGAA